MAIEQDIELLCGKCIHFNESRYPIHKDFGYQFLESIKRLAQKDDPEFPEAFLGLVYEDRQRKMEEAGYGAGYIDCVAPMLLVGAYWVCKDSKSFSPKENLNT